MFLREWNLIYRAIRFLLGETLIADIADIFVQFPATDRWGV
ncbi:MAG: hypothetical protein V1927_00970 [Candidatus Omnitrophota bacterium]